MSRFPSPLRSFHPSVWLLAAVLAAGCVKMTGTADAGGVATDGPAASADAALLPDAAPAPTNCAQVRACIYACADTGCANRCLSSAPIQAQNAYKAVLDCSTQQCPMQDATCRCMAECLFPDGACTSFVDDCVQGVEDPFCEFACH